MYVIEQSIPQACYYIIMTATTVGYGDFYPVTPLGRVIAVIVAYSGIVSIALPVRMVLHRPSPRSIDGASNSSAPQTPTLIHDNYTTH